jgi:altronate dehydratase small subunit
LPKAGRVYVVSKRDNVATALDTISPGTVSVLGDADIHELTLFTALEKGHKAALCDIPKGADIIKYGAVIGVAASCIRAGEWVHVHNISSLYDMRSAAAIDPRTGKVTDTKYE